MQSMLSTDFGPSGLQAFLRGAAEYDVPVALYVFGPEELPV